MNVSDLTRASEGLRLVAYDDATGSPVRPGEAVRGTLTIGYGHTGPDVFVGQTITPEQAETWLLHDLKVAAVTAGLVIGAAAWAALDVVRKAALTDMAFNIGGHRLSQFRNMLDAIRQNDWPRAHDEALDSLWAKQVGYRAARNATMLLTGEWPTKLAA